MGGCRESSLHGDPGAYGLHLSTGPGQAGGEGYSVTHRIDEVIMRTYEDASWLESSAKLRMARKETTSMSCSHATDDHTVLIPYLGNVMCMWAF